MCRPRITSSPKAIQWSQLWTKLEAACPMNQPMIGVMASTTPKMRPIRSASVIRGLCRLEPLPMAAANASVDMARASTITDMGFIVYFQSGIDPRHNRTLDFWNGLSSSDNGPPRSDLALDDRGEHR